MRTNRKKVVVYIVGLLLLIGCQKPNPDETKIAEVNGRAITWKEIRRSFWLEPKWGKGLTYRQAFLLQTDYVIDQHLFAMEAEKIGLNRNKELQDRLHFLLEKEMVKKLYQQEVLSKISISEEEYLEAYSRSRKKVSFEYIRTPFRERAEFYVNMMKDKSVNEIGVSEGEEKGISPLMGFGELVPELEDVVFQLGKDEVAGPISIEGEFWVVKVIDGEIQKFASEYDFALAKSRLRKRIAERKAAPISKDYIHKLMDGITIHINPEVFRLLSDMLSRSLSGKVVFAPIDNPLTNEEIDQSEQNLGEILSRPLAEYDGKTMTVQEFLYRLKVIPENIRPKVHRPWLLADAIRKIIEHDYLAAEASRQGLARDRDVRFEYESEKVRLLSEEFLKMKYRNVSLSEQEYHDFKNSERFQKVSMIPDSELRNLLLKQKFSLAMVELADSLRHVSRIRTDTTMLIGRIKKPDQVIDFYPNQFLYREQYF